MIKIKKQAIENFENHFNEIDFLESDNQKRIFYNLFDIENERVDKFIQNDILNLNNVMWIDGKCYTLEEIESIVKKHEIDNED